MDFPSCIGGEPSGTGGNTERSSRDFRHNGLVAPEGSESGGREVDNARGTGGTWSKVFTGQTGHTERGDGTTGSSCPSIESGKRVG